MIDRRPPPRLGFTTLEKEVVLDTIEVRGEMPAWLRGSLLRTGPAKFEVGAAKYCHWFDGLAMLHRFSFEQGKVSYANRFLESNSYKTAKAEGRIAIREFATMPQGTWLQRTLTNLLGATTDNGNVNITRMGGQTVALTETTHALPFEPWTLATKSEMTFEDQLKAQVWTAHPHYDFKSRKLYNLLVSFGPKNVYRLFSMEDGSRRRVLVSEIPVQNPAYIHSFAMTENYLILTECPFVVTSIMLKVGSMAFIENYRWEPNRGTRMTIVRKSDGKIMSVHHSDPFFTFHHVNAFEEGSEVVLDLIRFPDATVIDRLYLEALRTPDHRLGTFERFRLPLSQSTAWIRSKAIGTEAIELPNINYRKHNAGSYRFAYAVADEPNVAFARLVKIDVVSCSQDIWQNANCYPGEPVFVASPNAVDEDDGVLLSLVLDETTESSFLLVLDARTMKEQARAILPHHVPFGFHGQYFDDVRRPG